MVHPELGDDLGLTIRRTRPVRGEVVGTDGTPIVTPRPVVDVGVEPARTDDVATLVDDLRDILAISGDGLAERIVSADPNAFVPVVTLREDAFAAVEDELLPLPGTVVRRGTLPLAPTADFARALLGRAGDVTAERIEAHPQRYAPGDVVGLSGLQRRYDEQLFGEAGRQVVAVPVADAPEGVEEAVLHEVPAVDGSDVTVTLDERVQRAADETLADVSDAPSALVAVRVSDGHVVAVANGPGTAGAEIAVSGQYAPGSTFKVVTTAALLADGLDPDATVGCEAEAVVDGRRFTNAEDGARGRVPFREAFAQSCNTTFVSLADDLDDDELAEAAGRFGVGGGHTLGVDAFTGSIPVNDGATDRAAAAIGQGRNLASPLAMADVAATVARGGHRTPRLVLDPDPRDPAGEAPLDPQLATDLQALTRQVVTDGTGSALADVPGDPVHGKTGTAEYGTETPPRTHAWFIGHQGDLAFAVLVAETRDSVGGRVAAPLAADFLTRLAD
ncbi:penicillin-binding transpeptidase domain-containing protein [Egicoccus halophilus]|uniref:penicillin-binding transpeptidase domain-containing protein n=1 Tax=Egicoccus halophilus TaxID=1670830 RepID=UPI0027E57EA7|nr:penicillin-binding transpeptidase domain-containing protein [Egicoccus halophilus]